MTPLQQQQVMQRAMRLVADAAAGERFDLYVADGDGVNTLAPVVSLCSPGRGVDANSLYQNPTMIQHAFDERFVGPLRQELGKLMEPSRRSSSPILESIRAVSVTSFGSIGPGAKRLHLTIVSDMVQHSAGLSQIRGDVEFSDFQRRPQWPELQSDLEGADVTVLYLLRSGARHPNGKPVQSRGHQVFWEQALRASGARSIALDSF
ncbi:hypothetical protein QMO56_18415 [Roseomonas sp. E05]|uniref:hypothetical protein n=1 Tax=Roseomonas sp. E05 TaxID=3046310 RepID=UPI0024BA3A90|nr:hypothetical protein [Roseomonas sp. E05]MDJ0390087.1 hypothetical protein [Roseomonas sp. E05]